MQQVEIMFDIRNADNENRDKGHFADHFQGIIGSERAIEQS